MKEKIEAALKTLEDCKDEFKEWVKNKSISLDERWNLFIKSGLGKRERFYEEFAGVNSDDYYDKYYIERYKTVSVDDLYKWATNGTSPDLNTQEKKDAFREDVLNKFIYSFEMDW